MDQLRGNSLQTFRLYTVIPPEAFGHGGTEVLARNPNRGILISHDKIRFSTVFSGGICIFWGNPFGGLVTIFFPVKRPEKHKITKGLWTPRKQFSKVVKHLYKKFFTNTLLKRNQ